MKRVEPSSPQATFPALPAKSNQPSNVASGDRPGEFLRLEVWRNPEALELHKASPYLKASFERRKDQGWMTEISRWKRVPQEQGTAQIR
jgi:hypothetical protein